MMNGKSVCVFCGSNVGALPDYARSARELGRALAREDCALVYGGGGVGLMGVLADSVLDAGGRIVGVIPRSLATIELAHPRVAEMRVVNDMHSRKALMSELSLGSIALPGGFGTLDELVEAVTWAQLGIHDKPIGLLNVAGFFDPLLKFIDHAVSQRFIHARHARLLVVDDDPHRLLKTILGVASGARVQRGEIKEGSMEPRV
jgi:uncharacterized protein (TIGR00730 family)